MKILTFGEIMLRLKTPEHLRIVQANGFEASYGGAESNVAVSLSTLGDDPGRRSGAVQEPGRRQVRHERP